MRRRPRASASERSGGGWQVSRYQRGELLLGHEKEIHVRCRDLDSPLDREPLSDTAAAGEPLEIVTGRPVTPCVPNDAVNPHRGMQIGLAT